MRLLKLTSIGASVLIVIALLSNTTRSTIFSHPSTGMIKGLVLDANGARVPNAIVRVESRKTKRSLRTRENGEFEVEVPAATYRLMVEADGFRRFTYSPLKVVPNETTVINVHLEVAEPPGLVPAAKSSRNSNARDH